MSSDNGILLSTEAGYWEDDEFWTVYPCGEGYVCEEGDADHTPPASVQCYGSEGGIVFLCADHRARKKRLK